MKSRENIIELFTIYGKLLTTKQQDIFKDYYYEDLSLSEISENNNISKSYVGKSLQIISEKLQNYEKALKIKHKNTKILDQIKDINLKESIEKIINE